MAYLSFEQYTQNGHNAVAEPEFERWALMAEQYARLYTFERLVDADITDTHRRGLCELVDLLHNDEKQLNRALMSYTNGQYSETYGLPSKTVTVSLQQKVGALLRLYFTQAQLYRGV